MHNWTDYILIFIITAFWDLFWQQMLKGNIYQNNFDHAREHIRRSPKPLPTISMPKFNTISDVIMAKPKDFKLNDYDPMESIKAPMAV